MSSIGTLLKSAALGLAIVAGAGAAAPNAQAADVRIGVVFAPFAPPPPRHEYVPRHHARYEAWERGHWDWRGHGWYWVPGHFVRAPRHDRHIHWQDGRWDRRNGHYEWTGGRWR